MAAGGDRLLAWMLPSSNGRATLRAVHVASADRTLGSSGWMLRLDSRGSRRPVARRRDRLQRGAVGTGRAPPPARPAGRVAGPPLPAIATRRCICAAQLSAGPAHEVTLVFDDSPALVLGRGHTRCALTLRRDLTVLTDQFAVDQSCLQILRDGLVLPAGSSVELSRMPGRDLTVDGDPSSCWWHGGGRQRPSGADRAPGETAERAAGST